MSVPVLELRNIVKTFPGVLALDHVSFDLRSGEVHAICGENGAGKSTLMKVISGVYAQDSGEIFIKGEPQVFKNPMESYKKGVSIIFQETSLFEEMTVLENMFLGHEKSKRAGVFKILDYPVMREKAQQIFRRLNTDIDVDGSR